jgi:DNA-binding winged helix-turn-helix (wHTH) protein
MRIFFGPFEADLRSGELRCEGRPVPVQRQPFEVLAALLEQPGELVSRDALRGRIWPDVFVDYEHCLNTAVRKLRRALGDSPRAPRFVETVARRGYRWRSELAAAEAS